MEMMRSINYWIGRLVMLIALMGPLSCGFGDSSVKKLDYEDTDSGNADSSDSNPVDPKINWIKIPAGSFVFGSPVGITECRGPVAEREVPVTISRPFLMAATEITQQQWTALEFSHNSYHQDCPNCPVDTVDFYEAASWCNRLSEFEGITPCYDLSCYHGTMGAGCPEGDTKDHCTDNGPDDLCINSLRRYPRMYDCPGYRLPTAAEWEYAAKATTKTNTYNGDLIMEKGVCLPSDVLEPIAWYCFNSDGSSHEVGQKTPNAFGLHDMIGNIREWVDYFDDGGPLDVYEGKPGESLVDPMGLAEGISMATGGCGWMYPEACYCTASYTVPFKPHYRANILGFRPVRTVQEK